MNVPSCELMPVIRAALERGQRVSMTVNGSSMSPFIRDGDVVELELLRSLPRQGDVVLVQCPEERYVLHQVVRIDGNAFFLCGYAQRRREGPFVHNALVARVVRVYRGRRTIALDRGLWRLARLVWLHCSPLGLALLLLAYRIRAIGRDFWRRL
jgi:hypothetical protein